MIFSDESFFWSKWAKSEKDRVLELPFNADSGDSEATTVQEKVGE